mgnify:CR=1 FL=1
MLKNDTSSRSRFARNVMLPTCAPAMSVIMTPARLYHPRPDATAAPVGSDMPASGAQTSPPSTDPATMPAGHDEHAHMVLAQLAQEAAAAAQR